MASSSWLCRDLVGKTTVSRSLSGSQNFLSAQILYSSSMILMLSLCWDRHSIQMTRGVEPWLLMHMHRLFLFLTQDQKSSKCSKCLLCLKDATKNNQGLITEIKLIKLNSKSVYETWDTVQNTRVTLSVTHSHLIMALPFLVKPKCLPGNRLINYKLEIVSSRQEVNLKYFYLLKKSKQISFVLYYNISLILAVRSLKG